MKTRVCNRKRRDGMATLDIRRMEGSGTMISGGEKNVNGMDVVMEPGSESQRGDVGESEPVRKERKNQWERQRRRKEKRGTGPESQSDKRRGREPFWRYGLKERE